MPKNCVFVLQFFLDVVCFDACFVAITTAFAAEGCEAFATFKLLYF